MGSDGSIRYDPEIAAALLQATGIVASVAASLDRNSHVCESCGLAVAENIQEMRVAEQLDGVTRRLERFAAEFRDVAHR